MSASLVGSEMCIRDRRCSARGGILKSSGLDRTTLQSAPPVRERRNALAVSYTHLTLPTICSV
eukprot:12430487-Alexandrium_andersonii.AAC.1